MKKTLRLSLGVFLILIGVGGAGMGMIGRSMLRDEYCTRRVVFPDGTQVAAHYRSTKPSAVPAFVILVPRMSPLGIGVNTYSANRVGGGSSFNKANITPIGTLEFEGRTLPLESGRRVFLFTSERTLRPLDIPDDRLSELRLDKLAQAGSSPFYVQEVAPRVREEGFDIHEFHRNRIRTSVP